MSADPARSPEPDARRRAGEPDTSADPTGSPGANARAGQADLSVDPTGSPGADARRRAGVERAERLARCLMRARAGETTALDEVVRELTPLLWHVARAQGLDVTEASDVVQTTWVELLRRLDEIRSPRALTAWLISTARREAWRLNRQRRRLGDGDEVADVADTAPALDERVVTAERDRALWTHFQQLSDRCRELLRVVAMVDRPDYSIVSEALSMPHGSIGPTRGRCLGKLRERLLADPLWGSP